MENIRTIAGRIDKAFGTLLMAKDMIETTIPNSDDEEARALAAKFAAKLIKTAIDQLTISSGNNAKIYQSPVGA